MTYAAISMGEDGKVTVSVDCLQEMARVFSEEYQGNYSGLEIVVLALMHGIEAGYAAAEAKRQESGR